MTDIQLQGARYCKVLGTVLWLNMCGSPMNLVCYCFALKRRIILNRLVLFPIHGLEESRTNDGIDPLDPSKFDCEI
jgi:hypothetical protein